MTEPRLSWSKSQQQAFSYIRQGVGTGLSAARALREYRTGGGAIRDSSWYSLYRETFAQEGWKETVKQIPMTYVVRENMFQPTDWDFREKYIMQMKVSGFSEEIGRRVTKWVTVENDKLLTKQEWRWYAQEAVNNTIGSIPFEIDRVYEYAPLVRVR